jgi:GAF domain-containing protein
MTDVSAMSARLAALLLPRDTVTDGLRVVTVVAREALAGTVGAGITLGAEGNPFTAAASDPLVERADELQYGLDEGPCLTAWREQVIVRIDEIHASPRWPRWTRAVESLGIRSALAAPLTTTGDRIGVIQVYSRESAAYDDGSETLLTLFARQAAMLLVTLRAEGSIRRLAEEFLDALHTENLIGRAEGLLMAREGIAPEAAAALLRRTSAESREEPREVARRLVETGAGPARVHPALDL